LDIDFEIAASLTQIERLRRTLVLGRFDPIAISEADAALSVAGEALGIDTRREVYAAFTRAQIEHHRIYAASLQGRYDEVAPRDPLFANLQKAAVSPEPILGVEQGLSKPPRPLTVRDAVQRYINFKRDREWVHKTYLDTKRVLDLFMELSGADRPLDQIQTPDVQAFRDALLKLPTNYTKRPETRDLTVRQILDLPNSLGGLSAKTGTKYLDLLRSFLRWCVAEDALKMVPGEKTRMPGISRDASIDARHSFSAEHLQKIFSSPLYSGSKSLARRSVAGSEVIRDGKFWVPLIGIFTGMRLGEIVQLLVGDVVELNGVRAFRVTPGDNNERRLKTASSKRDIPVHRELLRCGFGQYLATLPQKGPADRLFPDLTIGKGGYASHAYGKWFARYLDDLGLTSSKLTFHSFRHNFKDAAYLANIPESQAMALMGHAEKGVHSNYGSGHAITILDEALQRLSYQLDLSHLH
jgi:integrase